MLRNLLAVHLLDGLALDLVMALESDDVLDLLARRDEIGFADSRVVAGAFELLESLAHEMELDADRERGVDAACIAHVLELSVAVKRALVAVPATLHINHRHLRELRRFHRV